MRIVITSYVFFPSSGGIETHSRLMAEYLVSQGDEVTIVTSTPSPSVDRFSFQVVRRPGVKRLFEILRSADLVLQNHPSLTLTWPLQFFHKTLVTFHHTWLVDDSWRALLISPLKRLFLKDSVHVANSMAIARQIGFPAQVVGNPYDEEIYFRRSTPKDAERWLFVGRLVSDKGIDLAINAFVLVLQNCPSARLTIVGEGEERESLIQEAMNLGIRGSIDFLGPLRGDDLVREYVRHAVCVIPSRWEEPFGMVALEALACGCRLVCSRVGGLSEAAGSFSDYFERDQVASCALALLRAAQKGEYSSEEWGRVGEHLRLFNKTSYFERLASIFYEALLKDSLS